MRYPISGGIPPMPDSFHNRITSTLREANDMKKRHKLTCALAAACAAIIAVAGIALAGSGLILRNNDNVDIKQAGDTGVEPSHSGIIDFYVDDMYMGNPANAHRGVYLEWSAETEYPGVALVYVYAYTTETYSDLYGEYNPVYVHSDNLHLISGNGAGDLDNRCEGRFGFSPEEASGGDIKLGVIVYTSDLPVSRDTETEMYNIMTGKSLAEYQAEGTPIDRVLKMDTLRGWTEVYKNTEKVLIIEDDEYGRARVNTDKYRDIAYLEEYYDTIGMAIEDGRIGRPFGPLTELGYIEPAEEFDAAASLDSFEQKNLLNEPFEYQGVRYDIFVDEVVEQAQTLGVSMRIYPQYDDFFLPFDVNDSSKTAENWCIAVRIMDSELNTYQTDMSSVQRYMEYDTPAERVETLREFYGETMGTDEDGERYIRWEFNIDKPAALPATFILTFTSTYTNYSPSETEHFTITVG